MTTSNQPGSMMTDELINLLREIRPDFSDVGSRDVDTRRKQNQIDRAIALLSASKPAALDGELPPLPKPRQKGWIYDAAQMRAYAIEAIAAAPAAPAQSAEAVAWQRTRGLLACAITGFITSNPVGNLTDAASEMLEAVTASGGPLTWLRTATTHPTQPAKAGEWLPTAENINALPEPIRAYIAALETNCDPAGVVRENATLRHDNAEFESRLASQSAVVLDGERAIIPDDIAYALRVYGDARAGNGDSDATLRYVVRLIHQALARAASPQATATQAAPADELLVALFYAAQGDITKFRIKARALLAAAQPASGGDPPAQEA